LELSAIGVGQARPDTARIAVNFRAEGSTQAAAQTARDAVEQRIREAARVAGVATEDIRQDPITRNLEIFDIEEPPPPEEEPAAPGAPLSGQERPSSVGNLQIIVRQTDRLDALQAAIRQAGGVVVGRPTMTVSDDSVARRAARAEALAKVRADAEGYAAAMSMRVARIVRVTERGGFDFMAMIFGAMTGGGESAMLRERFEPANGQVPVPVFVGVDFVLVPR